MSIKNTLQALRLHLKNLGSAARTFAFQLHAADSRRLPG